MNSILFSYGAGFAPTFASEFMILIDLNLRGLWKYKC